jgi:hypothetical protein
MYLTAHIGGPGLPTVDRKALRHFHVGLVPTLGMCRLLPMLCTIIYYWIRGQSHCADIHTRPTALLSKEPPVKQIQQRRSITRQC